MTVHLRIWADVYCFDTDVLSSVLRPVPSLAVIRRLTSTRPDEQNTTSVTVGELLYGAIRKGRGRLISEIGAMLDGEIRVLPFDRRAAETYATLRAELEAAGRRLAEPDLRIAAISLSRDLTLVTGNVRHFGRVPGLRVENWLEA